MGEQRVQEGAEHTPWWGPCVEDQQSGGAVSYLHHLGAARQEVGKAPCLMMSLEGTMVLKAVL